MLCANAGERRWQHHPPEGVRGVDHSVTDDWEVIRPEPGDAYLEFAVLAGAWDGALSDAPSQCSTSFPPFTRNVSKVNAS